MKNFKPQAITIAICSLMLLMLVSTPAIAVKPMPPHFAFGNEPGDVLTNYPLGVINEQDAFAHHGGPIVKEELPNGNQGWVYKSGEKAGVPSIYVLRFSKDGIVIDVLHKDYRYKIGHSALQYQYLINKDPESRTAGAKPVQ